MGGRGARRRNPDHPRPQEYLQHNARVGRGWQNTVRNPTARTGAGPCSTSSFGGCRRCSRPCRFHRTPDSKRSNAANRERTGRRTSAVRLRSCSATCWPCCSGSPAMLGPRSPPPFPLSYRDGSSATLTPCSRGKSPVVSEPHPVNRTPTGAAQRHPPRSGNI
jgi:hypothetical protein